MPGVTLPPDQGGSIVRTIERVERVERQTIPDTSLAGQVTQVFSYPGVVAANIESPPWYPHHHGVIQTVRLSFRATTTGTTTIELRVDGAPIQQFSITVGNKTVITGTAIPVNIGSYVTIKTITVTGVDADMAVNVAL